MYLAWNYADLERLSIYSLTVLWVQIESELCYTEYVTLYIVCHITIWLTYIYIYFSLLSHILILFSRPSSLILNIWLLSFMIKE